MGSSDAIRNKVRRSPKYAERLGSVRSCFWLVVREALLKVWGSPDLRVVCYSEYAYKAASTTILAENCTTSFSF